MRFHIRAKNRIDAGLVAALLPEPRKQIRIEAHRHDRFIGRQNNLGGFPEFFIGRTSIRIGENGGMGFRVGHAA